MSKSHAKLGALLSTHGTSPAALQRGAIVTGLSFLFFMGTLVIFYVQQSIAYFVLSTAFLVVYIFTLVGWVMQKRNIVSIYENGITYKKFAATWDDITSVTADSAAGISITNANGDKTTISRAVSDFGIVATTIKKHLP